MIDLVLLVVIGGSTVLGLLRGFVGTLVSTIAWLLSGWVAFRFGEQAAFWFSDDGVPSPSELMGGYAATFMVVMVGVTLVGMLIKSMVKSVGLSGVDRMLGMGLGVLRGAFLGCLLVLLMGFTSMPSEPSWKQSQILPLLVPGADWMHGQLPDWSVPETDPLNAPATGDNGEVDGLPTPLLEGAVLQVINSAKDRLPSQGPESAGPAGDHPENIEPAGQEPADRASAGQAPADADTGTHRTTGKSRPKSQ